MDEIIVKRNNQNLDAALKSFKEFAASNFKRD